MAIGRRDADGDRTTGSRMDDRTTRRRMDDRMDFFGAREGTVSTALINSNEKLNKNLFLYKL